MKTLKEKIFSFSFNREEETFQERFEQHNEDPMYMVELLISQYEKQFFLTEKNERDIKQLYELLNCPINLPKISVEKKERILIILQHLEKLLTEKVILK